MELPFLGLEDVVAIDAACAVVEHQAKKHLLAGRKADADRTFAIADDLRVILERHATAVRASHPTHRLPATSHSDRQPASQDRPSSTLRRPEPTQ
jgi:hypothetical protein